MDKRDGLGWVGSGSANTRLGHPTSHLAHSNCTQLSLGYMVSKEALDHV